MKTIFTTFFLALISVFGISQTWEQLPYYYPQNYLGRAKIFTSPNNVLVAGLKAKPGPPTRASHVSLDGGTTWQQIFSNKPIISAEFGPDGTIYFISSAEYSNTGIFQIDTLFSSTDGVNWINMGYKLNAGENESEFAISGNNTLLFRKDWSGTDKVFSKSTDNGLTWTLTNVKSSPITCSYTADTIITNFGSPWPGGIKYSHDGGTTVNVATGISAESFPIILPNGDIYAATPNQFYKSTDGGVTFTQLPDVPQPFGFVQEFLYAPNGKFYIRVSGAAIGIWETSDFVSFNAVSATLPNWNLVWDIDVSNNYLYAVTDTNLYRYSIGSASSVSSIENKIFGNIYPNPLKDYLNIESAVEGKITVEIIDLQGKEVLNTTMQFYANSINKLSIPSSLSGLYFIRLTNEKGEVQQQKIIIE